MSSRVPQPDDRAPRPVTPHSQGSVQTGFGTRSFIPEVESLRGLAIVLVFLFHAFGHGRAEIVSPAMVFVMAGYTGVDLFFVLSSFLLTRPFLVEVAGGSRVDRGRYFARRALRILPLYWATLVAATLLTAATAEDLLRGLPYLVFLNAVAGATEVLAPYSAVWWSLATEMQFYLLLPLLPLLAKRRWSLGLAFALYAACYAAMAMGYYPVESWEGKLHLVKSVFGRGPLFLWGGAAAWLCLRFGERIRRWAHASPWLRSGGADLLLLGVIVALGYLLRWVAALGYVPAEIRSPAWHIAEGGLWASVLLLILLAPLKIKVLLSNRGWAFLGLISYSIYMLHLPLLSFGFNDWLELRKFGMPMRVLGIAFLAGVCVAGSALTYRLIERPFLRRKARIAWWSSRPAG